MDTNEEIRKVAYELYEKSGRIGGRDLENWIEAERIVMARRARQKNDIKVNTPAAAHQTRKTPARAKVSKPEAQAKGPGAAEARKPRTKKTLPKKTARTPK